MSFSIGQNFFKDMLHYTDENSKEDHKVQNAFALQGRACEYFKNNQYPTLYKSQKFSGNVTIDGKPSALGGQINHNESGSGNVPGSGICTPEFPFWNFTKPDKSNKKEEYKNSYGDESDKFEFYNKEHFGKSVNDGNNNKKTNTEMWIIISIIVIVLLILSYFFFIRKNKVNTFTRVPIVTNVTGVSKSPFM